MFPGQSDCRYKRVVVAIAVVAVMTVAVIDSVQAQDDSTDDIELHPRITAMDSELWLSSTSSTSTTLAVGVGLLSLQLVARADGQIRTYMRQNAVAIQHDLHLGAGDTAEDLAGLFGIDKKNIDAFGRLLYEHRRQLAPLAEPGEIDAISATQFTHIVIDEMVDHEDLAADGGRLAAIFYENSFK